METKPRPNWFVGLLAGLMCLAALLTTSHDETARTIGIGMLFCGGVSFVPLGLVWVFWPKIVEAWRNRKGGGMKVEVFSSLLLFALASNKITPEGWFFIAMGVLLLIGILIMWNWRQKE